MRISIYTFVASISATVMATAMAADIGARYPEYTVNWAFPVIAIAWCAAYFWLGWLAGRDND